MGNGIILSEKQNEFILNCNHRYNFKVGAVRSGKSFCDIAYVIPARIRAGSGKSGLNLILGVSKESIERNVLKPMREIYTERLVGNIKAVNNIALIFGEPCYCLGAEKASQVSKIQGMSVKYAYGDEVAKWSKEVFKMLQSRLDKEYSCFDGSLNPESPNHWLKKEFLDNDKIDAYIQNYIIDDNPYLPKEFISNLKQEYVGVYYDRYILGKWALAEGLIYPNYKDAYGDCPFILNKNTFKSMDKFCISVDYGTLNAFAAALWVEVNGIWWLWKVYYYSGRETGIQKTDNEYAEALIDFVDPIFYIQKELIQSYQKDDFEKLDVVVDPSAASFIAEIKKLNIFKVHKADNAVLDGIRNVGTAIARDQIKVDKKIDVWEKEIGSYVWDDKISDTEKPIKINDHLADAVRYFVRYKRLGKIKDVPNSKAAEKASKYLPDVAINEYY